MRYQVRTGTRTSSMETSARAKARWARKLRREEESWKARNGPVTVRRVDPAELRRSK